MKYSKLLNLKVSKLCLGTHQFFDKKKNVDSLEAKKILYYALNQNINFFDTADEYGNTKCEEFIGNYFYKKKNIVIASKVGQLINFSKDKLQSSIDNSLKRLRRESIDIYYFHSGTNNQFFNDDFWELMHCNVKNGKIKNLGLSIKSSYIKNNDFKQIKACKKYNIKILNLMFNPLFTNGEKIFNFCKLNNINLISRVPFAKGQIFKETKSKVLSDESMNKIAKNSLKWIDSLKSFKSIVFGVSNLNQLKGILK